MFKMNRIAQIGHAVRIIASAGPRFGTFFLNTDCNLECPYCVVPKEGSGVKLPTETWCRIIDRVQSWGVRMGSFLGGEPTLRKDLPEIIGHAAGKIATSLTSNGDTFVGGGGSRTIEGLGRKWALYTQPFTS